MVEEGEYDVVHVGVDQHLREGQEGIETNAHPRGAAKTTGQMCAVCAGLPDYD